MNTPRDDDGAVLPDQRLEPLPQNVQEIRIDGITFWPMTRVHTTARALLGVPFAVGVFMGACIVYGMLQT